MVIFLYNLDIFVWIQHSCLANMVFALYPSIKRLLYIIECSLLNVSCFVCVCMYVCTCIMHTAVQVKWNYVFIISSKNMNHIIIISCC